MIETLNNIEPAGIWKYFQEICRIPRLSKNEERIISYLINFARENSLEFRQDKAGNLLIVKNASPGKEDISPVVLQCHVDIVGDKEINTLHDFNKDPIVPVIKGNWVTASGTTLGADDGIGIAAIMALLEDKNSQHGQLECLFTIDEETGMTGATGLETGFIKSKILLKLDSEDEGQFFIGCAGGVDTIGRLKIKTKSKKNKLKTYLVKISGLMGGHSGDEIHKKHGNAIILLNRFLWNASKEFNIAISKFEGGSLRNAIPRDAEALITVPAKQIRYFESFFQIFAGILHKEYESTEPGLRFVLKESSPASSLLTNKLQQRLLNALYSCPHGVIEWSKDMEGLPETSTNLASVKFKDNNEIIITTSQRSSVDSAKKDISNRIASIFRLAGAKIEQTTGYPGWTPDPNSEILKIATKSYKKLFRKKPAAKTIHAGLECGLILEKYPGMDLISFGPNIRGAHTPKERININSTLKFWKLLNEILKNIPKS